MKYGIIAIAIIAMFTGCVNKQIEYVDRPFDRIVVKSCEVPKITQCEYGKETYTGEINQMRLCIRQLQDAIEVCSKGDSK